ncbi:MAG: hypothetical protein ACREDQ_07030 [Limisphaerales bacterium]
MTPTNGFQAVGDIGGPKNIGEGYRWNVPVVTYAFDPSFEAFFGSNGVAAVESAIQILNALPPASQLDPSTYPLNATSENYIANAEGLIDLKSETLFLLFQQLGLAQPLRYMFCVHDFSVADGNTNVNVILRNFDPFSYAPTNVLNDEFYTSYLIWQTNTNGQVEGVTAYAIPSDPLFQNPTVADGLIGTSPGYFYTGLTRDDVGGLRYLLETNNYNLESLLPDVHGVGVNSNNYVNLALRGGVDKITFVREMVDPITGEFYTPVTNQYTDTYVTNGILAQQQVERVSYRPDFLFSAQDFYNLNVPPLALYSCTGTSNWINNAGSPGGAGPGVIQPPVVITLNKAIGREFVTFGSYSDTTAIDQSQFLGSFDSSTNPPVIYPVAPQSGSVPLTVQMWLTIGQARESFGWEPVSAIGAVFAMQTSTDLTNWVNLFTVANNGRICNYFVYNPASAQRFYRFIPQ